MPPTVQLWELQFLCEFHCWRHTPTVKLFARFHGPRRPGRSRSYPQFAALVAMPNFAPSKILAGSWMLAKWVAVDAAEYVSAHGKVRYRVGVYAASFARVYDCPVSVATEQIAKLYGVWVLVKYLATRLISQATVLHDNIQAFRVTVNLRAPNGIGSSGGSCVQLYIGCETNGPPYGLGSYTFTACGPPFSCA